MPLLHIGKPLPDRLAHHPLVDMVTFKMNEIMTDSDSAPDWIMLKKDIE